MASDKPSVVFRVDGGVRLGSGHVMRCLSLADEILRRGGKAQFICRELAGNLIERIERKGYPVVRLGTPKAAALQTESVSSEWFGVPRAQDAQETRLVLEQLRPDWLVADHYGVEVEWERVQRRVVEHILVIDDLADRPHDCDLLLDQNYFGTATAGRYAGLVPDHCRMLLGPRYALMQREYAQLRAVLLPREAKTQRVLVFFGGSDTTDQTSKALRALCAPEFAHLAVDVVLGFNHPDAKGVEALVTGRAGTVLYRELRSLAGLMCRADLAIGAGGTTTWERLCLDLPSVVITLAANQEQLTASLADEGLVVWAGGTSVSVDELVDAIRLALRSPQSFPPLVDGHGLARVGVALTPLRSDNMYLERAIDSDAGIFFDWRNEALTRAMSFDQEVIDWETHVRWFQCKLSDPDVQMFIGRVDGLPVGQVRIDFAEDQAVLSYGVDPIVRGLGFGTAIVEQAVSRVTRAPAAGFRAHVKAENIASRRIFECLGWDAQAEGTDFIFSRPGGESA